MTGRLSLRARLTLAISAITLVVAVPAVLVGSALLRADARQAAVDAEFERWGEFGPAVGVAVGTGETAIPVEAMEQGEIGVVGSVEIAGVEVIAETIDFDTAEAVYAAETLGSLRMEGVAVDGFADDAGAIVLLLSSGTVAVVDADGSVELGERSDPATPLLLASSITSVGGSVFVPTDRLDLDGRDFEVATRVVGGTEIGVIAEATDRLDALAGVSRALWGGVVALTLLAGVAAWILVGRALRPVAAITGRVAAITAGNLGERVPETGRPDEIGTLASTMNAMLGRLEADDLRRRRFVSDASHELRTPVAVLQNEAEVARRSPGATTVDALADVVSTESRRLGGLVEGLLAIARGDEAAVVGDGVIEVDVDEIVLAESRRTRRVAVDRRGVSAGRILAHPDDVSRVVTHLLDNAARHADHAVAVALEVDGGEVVLRVDDDGPGIPVAERERVFERFVRLDEARSRDQGGAGLGLAVVRSTVERSGGTVSVSDAPMGGARFEVRWPALEG